jgi:cytochrome c peroxidase
MPRFLNAALVASIAAALVGIAAGPMRAQTTKPDGQAPDYAKYRKVLVPLPQKPPIPADNPQTREKVELGKMIFWDRRVSKTGATSCAACHHPADYGAEPMTKSVGINGEIHLRNAQTVLNAAFLKSQFWAGEQPDLEQQALGAVRSHVAMRSWPKEVAERLNRLPEYRDRSMKVFGEPLTEENMGKAMAAFMRELITPDYPLARWLKGDNKALTAQQLRGMASFVDRGCIACHSGPVFSNSSLVRVQVPGGENDSGRERTTKNEADKYFFKVPNLLNVAKTAPYTHNGSIAKLDDMVRFMGKEMLRTELADPEVQDIVAFLGSLTGKMPQSFMTVPVLPPGIDVGDFGPGLTPGTKN